MSPCVSHKILMENFLISIQVHKYTSIQVYNIHYIKFFTPVKVKGEQALRL